MRTYGQTDLAKRIVAYRSFANANAPEDIQPVKHLFSFIFGNSTLLHGAVTQQSVDEEGQVLCSALKFPPCSLLYGSPIVEGGVGYANKL
jgi:hypothetical protein